MEFSVLTQKSLLSIRWPGLRFFPAVQWEVKTNDILNVKRCFLLLWTEVEASQEHGRNIATWNPEC